ncbi:MAG: restriction endonuclease [Lachnospiraceae bacterium]|nr:restriction endonuclease [Lachnospiraceae bacterium]
MAKVEALIGIILIAVVIVILLSVIFWRLFVRRRRTSDIFEDMEGHEFEYFCADLLKQKGFVDVEVTKGSGDYGVDILAEKDGITYAIQCKRYTTPVGIKAVQEAYAGRDYYDRMVGAVMTNQYFTSPAVDAAKKLKILLWDGGYMESMMDEEQ